MNLKFLLIIMFFLSIAIFCKAQNCFPQKNLTALNLKNISNISDNTNNLDETLQLSLTLDANKFHDADSNKTKKNVDDYLRELNLQSMIIQDNDTYPAISLVKDGFIPQKGWFFPSEDEKVIAKIIKIPFVESVSFFKRNNGRGEYSIKFRQSNLPYKENLQLIKDLLPDFYDTTSRNKLMLNTIYVSVKNTTSGKRLDVQTLKKLVDSLKSNHHEILEAKVVRKITVLDVE